MLRNALTQDRDRGATTILVAFSLVVLLGVAAIAVDLGAGFNDRRQDQTAADLGAVAGALSFGDTTAIVDQVLAVSRTNLDTQFTNAQWQAAWQGCSDPDRTPDFIPLPEPAAWGSGTLDCISMSPSFLRVRVPIQETETSFGKVLGVDTLNTDASAVVTLLVPGGGSALPFAVVANTPAGEICLDTGPAGSSEPPCDGAMQGSFGNVAPTLHGNPFLGTSAECDQQTSANNHVAASIAMGMDHLIWKYPSSSWTATGWSRSANTSTNTVKNSTVNMDLCNETTVGSVTYAVASDGVPIDGVVIDTGNTVKDDVTEGLISDTPFIDGGKGLLWRTDAANTIDVKSQNDIYELDNVPLWAHLFADGNTNSSGGTVDYDDGGIYAPDSCDPDEFAGLATLDDKNIQMRTCLADYETGGFAGEILEDTVMDTPRFGVAPQLWHDNLGSGVSYRPVEQFRHVYLAGVWFDLKSHGPNEVFYAGYPGTEWCPVTKGSKCAQIEEVEQLTAFLLADFMLSANAKSTYPADQSALEPSIYE